MRGRRRATGEPAGHDAPQLVDQPDSRLARRLSTRDAVVVGVGSMLGAGVFAAVAPAAAAAGPALLLGLALAGAIAYCNATSSAQLAARHPASGGTYVYGRERLGPLWGAAAGWAFIAGKTGSCAAMALTFANYTAPAAALPLALVAVVTVAAINYGGVRKTATATKIIVAFVLVSLAAVAIGATGGGQAEVERLWTAAGVDAWGVLRAGGFLFFAFAGYARIATLGEEVRNPSDAIPRAIPLALGVVLVVYAVVMSAALVALPIERLAASPAPLADAVAAGGLDGLGVFARAGAAVASLGVLLSLLAGVGRTIFAMASQRDLPSFLDAVHSRFRTPHRAEAAVAAAVAALVLVSDFRTAIGFSSFTVLTYYAITNAAALKLSQAERRWPRTLAVAGLAGCILLAVSLPVAAVLSGAGIVAAGVLAYSATYWLRSRRATC